MASEIWERKLDEDSKFYHAFYDYLYKTDPWNRTVKNAYEHHMEHCANAEHGAVTLNTWVQWSKKWDWEDRARAYEDHLDEANRKFIETKARKARRDHVQIAEYALGMIAKKMEITDPENIPDGAMFSSLEKAVKMHQDSLDMNKKEEEEVKPPSVVINWHNAPPNLSEGLNQLTETLQENFKVPELELLASEEERDAESEKKEKSRWT